MMFGQALRALECEADESLALGLLPDLVLLSRARAAAAALDLTLNQYLLGACRSFLERADEEEWATLMSRLRDGAEPGLTLVSTAVQRRLDATRCGCTPGADMKASDRASLGPTPVAEARHE